MRSVAVLGNATVDLVQRVERLPLPGETLLSQGLERFAGGKGLNQAVAAARAGARVRLVAPLGTDSDAEFLKRTLAPEALRVDWRTIDAPTDVSAIWVAADGENMIVSSADCARALRADEAVAALEFLRAGDILILQGNLAAETTIAAASYARESEVGVVLNSAPIAWDMEALLANVDVLVANEREACQLANASAAEAAAALLRKGCGCVVVTRGPNGARLADGGDTVEFPAPRVEAIDTAGAGDVTVGVLAALLADNLKPREALPMAIAAASLSVTRPGTTLSFPSGAEIADLRRRRS